MLSVGLFSITRGHITKNINVEATVSVTCGVALRDVAVIPHDTHPGYSVKKFNTPSANVNHGHGHDGSVFNYRLLENGYSQFFTMLEDGSVMTTSDLSPLVDRPVSLVVLEETPNTTATHTLHLYVLDRRNMLRFEACEASECLGHVRENLAAGTRVTGVPPLRAGTGSGHQPFPITYSIVSGNEGGTFELEYNGDRQSNITVNERGAAVHLVTGQTLDREDLDKYLLTVQGSDAHGISRASIKISVRVDDENDNSPVFTEKVYRFVINEDDNYDSTSNVSLPLKRFSSIGRVEATDADGDRVAYRLLAPSNVVVIVPQTGELLLIEEPTEEIDCEFVVEAHDIRTPSRTSPRPAQILFQFRPKEPTKVELDLELQELEERELHRGKRRVTRAVRPTKRIEFTETDGETEGRNVFQLEKETDRETFKIRDENAWVTVEPNGAVRVKKKWDYEELGPEKTIDFWVTITNAGNGGKF
ncbi:Cadherin-N [Carabus blaptoides fortunei]